jgi:glycosyltransferase involved in cell wall biosynthesis
VGGIPSLVNPQNGFLVEYKNAAALAGAIKQIAEERVSFDRQALADRARTSFSMETVSGKYKSVYQQLLDD